MTPRTARFLAAFVRGGAGPVRQVETTIMVGGEPREATVFLPERAGRMPGWVVLHGLTVPGRRHEIPLGQILEERPAVDEVHGGATGLQERSVVGELVGGEVGGLEPRLAGGGADDPELGHGRAPGRVDQREARCVG